MENFNIPYEDMHKHIHHNLTVTPNGKHLVLECQTCYDDVAKVEDENLIKLAIPAPVESSGSCSMDGDCLACGS